MSKIISIHSFRGGTGKSNVTANLATILARSGCRVGIVDTDIQSPGIHVPFGLDAKKISHTLNDYLWGRCSIDSATYDVSYVFTGSKKGWFNRNQSKGKIFLIPSSIKTGEISKILREGYDARLLNDGFRNLIKHLKLDYQGTAVTVDVARKLDVPKMLLIVNKALSSLNQQTLQQQIQTSYKVPVAGILPVCEEMFHLASSDIFCLRYPEHPWTKTVEQISRCLVDKKTLSTARFGKMRV